MIVCFASLMHMLWGLLLLVNQGALNITADSTFAMVASYEPRAVAYFVLGMLPLFVLIKPQWSLTGLLVCSPQLVLLVLSGISALNAITQGQYPDGTARGWVFVAMDQVVYILLPIMYAFETLDRFHDQSAAKQKKQKASVIVHLGDS